MLKNRKYGFTLVELLASIVVLAIILVIAVPKVMNIINDAKKGVFANSVKLIASGAEQIHAENEAMGIDDKITCESVAQINSEDYKLCEISFEKDEARVTVIGDGKYNGLSVVYASKTNAVVQDGEPERLYTFDDLYNIIDDLKNEVNDYKNRIEELEKNSVTDESIETIKNNIENHELAINNLTNKDNTNNIFLQNYPIGSIYVSTESSNPGTKFGGTWVAFGAGRTLVGVDSSQTEFASVGLTGGAKTHTLTINEMPSHNHTRGTMNITGSFRFNSDENNAGIDAPAVGTGAFTGINEIGSGSSPDATTWGVGVGFNFDASKTWTGSTSSTGSSKSHNNLQPYITVYMWKRTA